MERIALVVAFGLAASPFIGLAGAQPGVSILGVLPGGGGLIISEGFGVSANGTWVVGATSSANAGANSEPFRWSAATSMHSLGPFAGNYRGIAYAISSDGSVVVGQNTNGPAFRWTQAAGRVSLGALPGHTGARAMAVSHDGSVIVGISGEELGFIWTEGTGMAPIPDFPVSRAFAISADGNVVVGSGEASGPFTFRQVLYWRREAGPPMLIEPPPGFPESNFSGFSVSPNGKMVAGIATGGSHDQFAFLWSLQHGYRLLPSLGDCRAMGVNDDGSFVVGRCSSGQARATVWVGDFASGIYQAHFLDDYLRSRGFTVPVGNNFHRADALSADGGSIVGFGVLDNQLTAYRVQFCYANCDGSSTAPFLNIDDFTCFIDAFAHARTLPAIEQTYNRANCDGSTVHPVLNIDDFTCFINRFAIGCESP